MKPSKTRIVKYLPPFLYAFLVAVLLFQLGHLVARQITPSLKRVWDLRQMGPWERSSLQQGGDIGYYVQFLNKHIPDDALVMIPPRIPQRPVAHIGFMQYYLFPREIHNCGVDEVPECIHRARGDRIYILSVEGFPPDDVSVERKSYIAFDQEKGLYVPESALR